MCKLFPGARCANHTWSDYTRENKNRKELLKELEKYAAHYPDEKDQVGKINDSLEFAKILSKLRESEEKTHKAMLEYESTPAGNKRLQDRLRKAREAGNEVEAAELEQRIADAQKRRRVQEHATRLQTKADRVTRTMSESEMEIFSNISEVSSNCDSLVQQLAEENREIVMHHKNARTRANNEWSNMTDHFKEVEGKQKELARHAYNAYIQAGIQDNLARGYTEDFLTSFRARWAYFTEDSTIRTPIFQAPTFKVKGQDHENQEPTIVARAIFESNPKVAELMSEIDEANSQYAHSVNSAQRTAKRFTEIDHEFKNVTSRYEELKQSALSSQNDKDEFIALRASDLHSIPTYEVNVSQFRKSAYINEDGKSNAFVRVKYSKNAAPYYARVEGIVHGNDGTPYIALENGDKLTPEEFGRKVIKLIKPEENAQKMF